MKIYVEKLQWLQIPQEVVQTYSIWFNPLPFYASIITSKCTLPICTTPFHLSPLPLPFTTSFLRKIQLYSYAVINGICEGCPLSKNKVYAEQERISGGGIGLLSISHTPRGGQKVKAQQLTTNPISCFKQLPICRVALATTPLPSPHPPSSPHPSPSDFLWH